MRTRLVILGCGWGSYSVLRNINRKLYDITVISPRNHFLFTPLLASTCVGTLEFRSIVEPIRNAGFRPTDNFYLARATGLDTDAKKIRCQNVLDQSRTYHVAYDHLVIGVGALSNTFGIPGVDQHACFLKEVSDAREIRRRLLSNFELAVQPGTSKDRKYQLLHTVIVGGGPTGVEFGAELYDFIQQDVTRLYRNEAQMARVTLVESNKILATFDSRLSAYAERKIKKRPQFTLVKGAVAGVQGDSVTLSTGEVLSCGLVVWSTGLAPQPFIKELKLQKTSSGQLLTDDHLRVVDDPSGSIFAIGDCTSILNAPLPCTAQVAEKQGRHLAEILNKSQFTTHSKPFQFKSLGMLAYIGDYQAVSDLPEVKLHGYSSWFLWRSAYFTRLGSWRLRMQVPMDWTKAFIYGRDTAIV